ncbi:helix-turn-helix domain-containing protein [uncultured Paracoccus sp.]|uniref:winged helix-turn-helix transcriptional regulator n=1 Tax=uncultured Paracoccus sp. TaxID=189685 RepID=UPI002606B858|nr:helix-turn-helix domain-containing protein [uncultured Paracoccus sp.]
MPDTRRTYGEGCIAAHALDLIGDRWALLIVRELMLGPKRFGAIRARVPGIATNMLTRRLADLESAGILRRADLPPPASVQVYELTAQGLALGPVLRALCHWGAGIPGHDPTLPISPTALMLSMQAMLVDPPSTPLQAGFAMDDEGFAVTLTDAGMQVRRAARPAGDLLFSGPPNAMAAAVYGPRKLAEVTGAGLVTLRGDPARGQDFVDRFRLARADAAPRPAAVAAG